MPRSGADGPSVHAVFGAPLALLAGDALIVMAFDALARGPPGRRNGWLHF